MKPLCSGKTYRGPYPARKPFSAGAAWIVVGTWLACGTWGFAAEPPASTGNWPAWRRDGSGVADDKQLPVVWSETQNVLWRTELPGEGNSSPVVWGNRVFLTAALDEGAKRLVLCIDAQTGKVLWEKELLPGLKTNYYPKTGFASPTPATDGDRVYVFFDEPGLVALDMQGQVVWTRRLGPFQCPYNMASSPMLYKDMVIQSCDHKGPAFLVALDRTSGAERWRTPRPSSGFGHHGTPLLVPTPGGAQLVVNGEPVKAYDPDTGKELWSCRGMKECVGPSPASGHGLVYASSGRIGPVMGIDPAGRGDVTETHVRLHLTSGGPYVPTPLVYPHLMVPGDNGRMLFYDSAGRLVMEGRVHDHFSASPIGGDGKIYWSSERGKTYVIDASRLTGQRPAVEVLSVNQLRGVCMGTPAIAGGRLLIRTSEALYCVGQTGAAGPVASVRALGGTLAELKRRYQQHLAHFENEGEARSRLETIEAIGRLDGPEVIEFLRFVAQKEEHWDVCEEAAKALGRKGLPAVDSLIALLPDSRPFIRTIAINDLGRLKVTKAVPAILKATGDQDRLVRSAALQALAQIGQEATPLFSEVVAAMTAALAKGTKEEPIVRQSALDGLALLASKVTDQRPAVIQALVAVMEDRNPRLAKRSQEVLEGVYKATRDEMEKARSGRGV
jgi:outer membrane protein assembly factor BamB/HEAT repeat protein